MMLQNRRLSLLLLAIASLTVVGIRAGMQTQQSAWADQGSGATQKVEPAAAAGDSEHDESANELPFSPILLELAVIIGVAMLGRWLAESLKQSAVLGELLIGVVIGNIGFWLGIPLFVMVMHLGEAMPLFSEVWLTGRSVTEAASEIFSASALAEGGSARRLVEMMTGPEGPRYVAMTFALWLFSELGVILLLFMVGLESEIDEMLAVGWRALLVAVTGVVAPFFLGLLVGMWLLPDAGATVHIFLAATLCATSVGITARVFRDLGKLQTREAKVILGAAVIDDVLGLIILAVVVGIASTGQIDALEIGRISLLSVLFLGSVILFGGNLVRWLVPLVAVFEKHHVKLLFPLALAFLLAWAASAIELAPIVGAFAAGLILSEEHFKNVSATATMANLIAPLERIFAPVFFVLMGMQVNLQSFLDPTTLWLALAFSAVAIIGKLVCGLPAGRGTDRWTIGQGMIPRGEVGLIFASIGKGLGVVSGSVFSALVAMVVVTTLITPISLKWSLFRTSGAEDKI
ncbi:cation:proton antiporter [Aeoliella sp.]|uniref:cation:proton antiporter n=1 Tax=Aeoliella sp. TaxID=2795800 RepID=UPI003CCB8AC0